MNAINETTIISETQNRVVTTEKYINDQNKLLAIPPMKLKATYEIENGKISTISLDTLDTGRATIDAKRNPAIERFQEWCDSMGGYADFKYNEEGALELRKALVSYSKK